MTRHVDPHPLAAWIEARMSRGQFARLIGVSHSHVSLILARKRGVSLRVAMRIERATARRVRIRDMAGEVLPRSEAP